MGSLKRIKGKILENNNRIISRKKGIIYQGLLIDGRICTNKLRHTDVNGSV